MLRISVMLKPADGNYSGVFPSFRLNALLQL